MSLSPASILYDESGNAIGVLQDGSFYRLQVQSSLTVPKREHTFPDPVCRDAGGVGTPVLDMFDRLSTHASATTDRGSFREDFSTALETSLTGTLTFVAGVAVAGVATFFTTELTLDSFIRLSADPQSKATRVSKIISDTSLELEATYTGSAASGASTKSNLRYWPGAGATISQAGSNLVLSTGTSTSYSHAVRSFGSGTGAFIAYARISQHIENQNFALGFRTPSGNGEAVILMDGLDNSKVKFRTNFNKLEVQTTEYTFPEFKYGSDTFHRYRIDLASDTVTLKIDGVLIAQHTEHVPEPYSHVWAGVFAQNTGAVSSSTDLIVDTLFVASSEVVRVGLTSELEKAVVDSSGNLKVILPEAGVAISQPIMIAADSITLMSNSDNLHEMRHELGRIRRLLEILTDEKVAKGDVEYEHD